MCRRNESGRGPEGQRMNKLFPITMVVTAAALAVVVVLQLLELRAFGAFGG